eukprot:3312954-Prymnesium_polylepis.1
MEHRLFELAQWEELTETSNIRIPNGLTMHTYMYMCMHMHMHMYMYMYPFSTPPPQVPDPDCGLAGPAELVVVLYLPLYARARTSLRTRLGRIPSPPLKTVHE